MTTTALVAEIVTTGTEILLGDIVDTNAAWIAQQLREAGINLYYKTTVGDNEPRLRGVIEQGMARSDAIIVTGGLGPTVDDITRQAIANATGRPLVLHDAALRTLQERFARFGIEMTENNRQQAYIPDGAILIENPVGTAPGFIVETGRCAVIAVPGVPREMMHLMTATVLPYLRNRAGGSAIIRRRILRTFGIGESTLDHQLGALMHAANPTVGLAAHTGQVDIRIAARAETASEAERLLDEVEAQVRAAVGRYIYSTTPGESYEAVLAPQLAAAGLTLAILETNTQGLLAQRLDAALPGGRLVLLALAAGATSLPNELERLSDYHALPVEQMAALAEDAAVHVRAEGKAVLGVALVGTAGADEGIYGRQSGATWLAIAGPAGPYSERIPFGGQDEYTLVRITNQVLRRLAKQLETQEVGGE